MASTVAGGADPVRRYTTGGSWVLLDTATITDKPSGGDNVSRRSGHSHLRHELDEAGRVNTAVLSAPRQLRLSPLSGVGMSAMATNMRVEELNEPRGTVVEMLDGDVDVAMRRRWPAVKVAVHVDPPRRHVSHRLVGKHDPHTLVCHLEWVDDLPPTHGEHVEALRRVMVARHEELP
jgi:hypothetical protein